MAMHIEVLMPLTLADGRRLLAGGYTVGEDISEDDAETALSNPRWARETEQPAGRTVAQLRASAGNVVVEPVATPRGAPAASAADDAEQGRDAPGNAVVPPGGSSEASTVSAAPGDDKPAKKSGAKK